MYYLNYAHCSLHIFSYLGYPETSLFPTICTSDFNAQIENPICTAIFQCSNSRPDRKVYKQGRSEPGVDVPFVALILCCIQVVRLLFRAHGTPDLLS